MNKKVEAKDEKSKKRGTLGAVTHTHTHTHTSKI